MYLIYTTFAINFDFPYESLRYILIDGFSGVGILGERKNYPKRKFNRSEIHILRIIPINYDTGLDKNVELRHGIPS